jgi:hypothetical protein
MNNAIYYRYGLGLQYQFQNSPEQIGTTPYVPIDKPLDYSISPAPKNTRYLVTDYPDQTIDLEYINKSTKPDIHKINIPLGIAATGLTTFTKDGLFTIDGANRITNKQKEPTIRLAPNVFHSSFTHYYS